MQLIPNHIDELIARCLAKNADASEQSSLAEWIVMSTENLKYYEQMKFIFEISSQPTPNLSVNKDAAWDKIKFNFEENKVQLLPLQTNKNSSFSFMRIAAAVVVICVIGITVYYMFPSASDPRELLSISTNEKSIEQKLPDGSIVTVNPESRFTALHKSKREYKLIGNAYFEVKHNAKNPFIIHVNKLCIKDIGTSFSVEGDPKEDAVRVNVTEGEVHLYTNTKTGIHLTKGESGTYYKSMDVFEKTKDLSLTKNITFSMNFKNVTLEDIVLTLEKQFRKKIQFANEELKTCRMSVKFANSNLDEILEIIGETMDVWTTEENEVITLGGDGCNK